MKFGFALLKRPYLTPFWGQIGSNGTKSLFITQSIRWMDHTCRWPLCDPLYPPLKIFFGFTPPPGRSKRGLAFGAEKSENSEKEGWNHEKRAKTAKIWLEIMKRRLELARGLDPPPLSRKILPPHPLKKTSNTYDCM